MLFNKMFCKNFIIARWKLIIGPYTLTLTSPPLSVKTGVCVYAF
jgi:hypothetical protein